MLKLPLARSILARRVMAPLGNPGPHPGEEVQDSSMGRSR